MVDYKPQLWSFQVNVQSLLYVVSPLTRETGHSGEVFAARFDPTGQLIASGSMDRSISTADYKTFISGKILNRNSAMANSRSMRECWYDDWT